MKFRSIKGTKDILPSESPSWQALERAVGDVMHAFRYQEIRTPIFEQTSLFSRSIGELTDIVSKEMYTFLDRGGESITLRPEGTAATLRAFIQNNLGEQASLTKVYYLGPMFRQERPQAGRLRQFHQFGAEALGSRSPLLDVEMMLIPIRICGRLGLNDIDLRVNSVGCEKCRPAYKEELVAFLRGIAPKLSEDGRARIEKNPLRVLDSKDPSDQAATKDAPLLKDHLCNECSEHFAAVVAALKDVRQLFTLDPRLVRGLDYYTKTAFEITSGRLGAQDALAGGGRYDLLVEELDGKPTPGVGFAAGMERILIAQAKVTSPGQDIAGPAVYIVAADDTARGWAFRETTALRSKGVAAEMDYLARSVKAQMRDASKTGAVSVLVVGERELKEGKATLKNMTTGTEQPLSLTDLARTLAGA